jgi:hypothetical protein
MTLEEAKQFLVNEMKAIEGEKFYKAGMVLLGSLHVGPNIVRIAKWAKMPRKEVAEFSKVLRENGVWVNGNIEADWLDEEHGGMYFLLDMMVAAGMIERSPEDASSYSAVEEQKVTEEAPEEERARETGDGAHDSGAARGSHERAPGGTEAASSTTVGVEDGDEEALSGEGSEGRAGGSEGRAQALLDGPTVGSGQGSDQAKDEVAGSANEK